MDYIYIDTRILGTIVQLVDYFKREIFCKNNIVVYLKYYKNDYKSFRRILHQEGIRYQFFKKYSQIYLKPGGFVFYLFNAQSNCRVVANRNLTHVFITHGESSKASSVKPIIRIYDFVVCAGDAGIDRYLRYKIFSLYDVTGNRIIKLGNTFIGSTGLNVQNNVEDVVVYAPTWEGGVPEENYSSLSYVEGVAGILSGVANQKQVRKILIMLHPNTGHRLVVYQNYVISIVHQLTEMGIKVILKLSEGVLSLRNRIRLFMIGGTLVQNVGGYRAIYGICDISAIETQFLNENIPYKLLYSGNNKELLIHHQNNAVNDISVDLDNIFYNKVNNNHDFEYYHALRDYVIDDECQTIPLNKRIDFLKKSIENVIQQQDRC